MAIAGILVLPIVSWTQARKDAVAENVAAASEARARKDFAGAESVLQGCIKTSASDRQASLTCTLELGYTIQAGVRAGIWDKNRLSEAKAFFQQAIDTGDAPHRALGLNNLAFLYEDLGDLAEALSTMHRVFYSWELPLSSVNAGERATYWRNLAYFSLISGLLNDAYTDILKALGEGLDVESSLKEAAQIVSIAGGKCLSDPTPFPPQNRLGISPQLVVLRPGESTQFTVTDVLGRTRFDWSVDPPMGSIDKQGFYRAPSLATLAQMITVKAQYANGTVNVCAAVTTGPQGMTPKSVTGAAPVLWQRPFAMVAEIAAILRSNGRPDAVPAFALPYLRTAPLNSTGKLLFQEVVSAMSDISAGQPGETVPDWVKVLTSGPAGSDPAGKPATVEVRPWVSKAFEELDLISLSAWWTGKEAGELATGRRAVRHVLPHLTQASNGLSALSHFVLTRATTFQAGGLKDAAFNAYLASWTMDRDNLQAALGFAALLQESPGRKPSESTRAADRISAYYYHRLPGFHLLPRADDGNVQFVASNWKDLLQIYQLLGLVTTDPARHLRRGLKVRDHIQRLGEYDFTPGLYLELAKAQSSGKSENHAQIGQYYFDAADEFAGLAVTQRDSGSELFASAADALRKAADEDSRYAQPRVLINGSDETGILLNIRESDAKNARLSIGGQPVKSSIDPMPVVTASDIRWLRPVQPVVLTAKQSTFTVRVDDITAGSFSMYQPRDARSDEFRIVGPREGEVAIKGVAPRGYDSLRAEVLGAPAQACDSFMIRTVEVEHASIDGADGSFRLSLRRRLVAGEKITVTPMQNGNLAFEKRVDLFVTSESRLPDSISADFRAGEITRLGLPRTTNGGSSLPIVVETEAGIGWTIGTGELRKWSLGCSDYQVKPVPVAQVYSEFRLTPLVRPLIPSAGAATLQTIGVQPELEFGLLAPSLHRRVTTIQTGRLYAPYLAPLIKGGLDLTSGGTQSSRDFRFYAAGFRLGFIRFAQPEGGRFRVTPNLLDVTFGRWENFYVNNNANYGPRTRMEIRLRGVLPVSQLGLRFLPAPTLEFSTNRGAGLNDNRLVLGYDFDLGLLAGAIARSRR